MSEKLNGWLVMLRFLTPLMIGILLAQYNFDHQDRQELNHAVIQMELRRNHDITEIKQRLVRIEAIWEQYADRIDRIEKKANGVTTRER